MNTPAERTTLAAHPRPATDRRPLPAGWATHRGGRVAGLTIDVAYDPRRHDILTIDRGVPNPVVEDGLLDQGWRRLLRCDDAREVWSRDRATTMRVALHRLASALPDALGITR